MLSANLGVRLARGHIKESKAPILMLTSPFHPELPREAKRIGGKWDGGKWLFDPRDEKRVAELCERIYGVNPIGPPPELVTVQITIPEDESLGAELWGFGRLLVERRNASDDIWLGAGVIIIDGEFKQSAGSRREPKIGTPNSPVTLEIRDVPASLLTRERRAFTVIEDCQGEDMSIDQRINRIVEQIEALPPAGRAALFLRLRDVPVRDDL